MKECEAAEIAKMSQRRARKRLLECMDVTLDFGYDESLRSEIHTNLLYDTFTNSVLKGFSWKDVCKATELSQRLLTELIGKSVIDATGIYKEEALKSGIDNRNLAVHTDFFFSTFMQHYKLYQYVFQTQRQEKRFVSCVTVEAPAPPESLSEGKPPSLHEYQQKLKEIQARKRDVSDIQPLDHVDVELDQESLQCSQTEALKRVIAKVLEEIGKPMSDNIAEAINSTYDDLSTKLEETALPRPKQLGPPPRYQIKPALQMPKSTLAVKQSVPKTSAKGDRKKSPKAK